MQVVHQLIQAVLITFVILAGLPFYMAGWLTGIAVRCFQAGLNGYTKWTVNTVRSFK